MKQRRHLSLNSDSKLTEVESNKLRKLDIDKISSANTSGRISMFSKIVGKEKAIWLNTRFENDVMLKKQKEGMLRWERKTEMEEKWRTEIKLRISKIDKMLSPKALDLFFEELVSLSLGIGVTEGEAQKIIELTNKSNISKALMEKGGSRKSYEKARNELGKYIDQLKNSE